MMKEYVKDNGESNILYPVSEYFVSPQGEGIWSGTAMLFLRLAGCTVGKPYNREKYKDLPVYTEQCTLYDGRKFPCDTDYRVKDRMTIEQILAIIPDNIERVLITGGEPLMHKDLNTLISYLFDKGKKVHIETSGTIDKYLISDIWISVSPKFNCYLSMLRRANEIKILVDKDFDVHKRIDTLEDGIIKAISLFDIAKKTPTFLQPVNFENEVNADNLQRCFDIQQEYGSIFRLSPQGHKLMSQYTKELVR
jgi:7-carboxy-7-deazaguanine synthase